MYSIKQQSTNSVGIYYCGSDKIVEFFIAIHSMKHEVHSDFFMLMSSTFEPFATVYSVVLFYKMAKSIQLSTKRRRAVVIVCSALLSFIQ